MLLTASVVLFFFRHPPKRSSPLLLTTMWSPLFCLVLAGLTACCVSLPQIQYVNDKPYHLMQNMECRGGKIYEIDQVQDIDECKAACLHRNCRAVNLFQLGEFQFKCEILAYVNGYFPAQGAACYISYV
uniref:Apple domain-containing protein n=1 Tax=Globodera rostochiensis TaxID=31243 RepID=A0A914I8F7_GLORO